MCDFYKLTFFPFNEFLLFFYVHSFLVNFVQRRVMLTLLHLELFNSKSRGGNFVTPQPNLFLQTTLTVLPNVAPNPIFCPQSHFFYRFNPPRHYFLETPNFFVSILPQPLLQDSPTVLPDFNPQPCCPIFNPNLLSRPPTRFWLFPGPPTGLVDFPPT